MQGAQFATIQKTKAIIYADMAKTSPIGYISKGKTVKVGEVLRAYGTLLPIAISGKIGYIKVSDIALAPSFQDEIDKNTPKQKPTSRSEKISRKVFIDKLSKNNYFSYSLRPFTYKGDWETISQEQANSIVSGTGHYISFSHRSPNKSFHFGFGFGLDHLKQQTLEIAAYFLELNVDYAIIKNSLFSCELTTSFSHALEMLMQETSLNYRYKGNIYGWSYGAQFVLFPKSKISFGLSTLQRHLRLYAISPSGPFKVNTIFTNLKEITSTELQLSIMYRF